MSAFAMKPMFSDYEGFKAWMKGWRIMQARMTDDIRKARARAAEAQRTAPLETETATLRRDLSRLRVMAAKLMTLRKDALQRLARIRAMKTALKAQMDAFPLTFEKCAAVDFHFNKIHLEFPWMPMWTVKTRGKTYYVAHVEAGVPWTTRETPEGSTKGMIRFRNCALRLLPDGTAEIGGREHG